MTATATPSPNGTVSRRSRHPAHLPSKIEAAYQASEIRRQGTKTSRLDYAAGYEDGYRDALEEVQRTIGRQQKDLLAP
jgi:hypothetical protein